jgi:hypothetical protein
MLRYTNRKESPMIATAIKLQEATQEAVHDEMVMDVASHIFHSRNELNDEDFARALFEYSAILSAMTTTLVTNALLTKKEINELTSTIKEMEAMGKDIE